MLPKDSIAKLMKCSRAGITVKFVPSYPNAIHAIFAEIQYNLSYRKDLSKQIRYLLDGYLLIDQINLTDICRRLDLLVECSIDTSPTSARLGATYTLPILAFAKGLNHLLQSLGKKSRPVLSGKHWSLDDWEVRGISSLSDKMLGGNWQGPLPLVKVPSSERPTNPYFLVKKCTSSPSGIQLLSSDSPTK